MSLNEDGSVTLREGDFVYYNLVQPLVYYSMFKTRKFERANGGEVRAIDQEYTDEVVKNIWEKLNTSFLPLIKEVKHPFETVLDIFEAMDDERSEQ